MRWRRKNFPTPAGIEPMNPDRPSRSCKREIRKAYKNLKGIDDLGDLGVDECIILKRILKCATVWTKYM
jgi:hypothetical protein